MVQLFHNQNQLLLVTKSYLNDLSYKIIGCAIEVHKTLGPGLLESVYHDCLKKEFWLRNIYADSQLIVPVVYKGLILDPGLFSRR